MLDLESILKTWEKDAIIDDVHLDEASRDAAKLHAKYLEMLMTTKMQTKRRESKLKLLLKDKWLYYNGKMSKDEIDARGWSYDPFNGLSKPLKGEMDYYYNSDDDIIKANDAIEYLKLIIETLEEIINTLKWRHQTIKNMVEWQKFTNGV